ncbi:spore coat protein U domain-containing protein [Variovorax sp. HJSM1_2]|uniref:spore coat protein U domain-containing protein n=1 Tax=Variovorax sp. HJSM1_2 TaxID=3366263 RepID=UPI003BE14F97
MIDGVHMNCRNYAAATVAVVTLGAVLVSLHAQPAGNTSGQLLAKMVLYGGCFIKSAAAPAGRSPGLETLDFGVQPRGFTGVVTAGSAGSGDNTEIICSPEITSLSVSVSPGNNAGQGTSIGTGSRAVKQGENFLPYEVYSDAALKTAYPANAAPVGFTLPSNGMPMALPVHGRINKTNPGNLSPGSYVDVLQVTFTW